MLHKFELEKRLTFDPDPKPNRDSNMQIILDPSESGSYNAETS